MIFIKIGNKLRILRINAGLTQAELGKKVNLSRANISKYESDDIEPNLATLNMFAKIFGVSADTILGITDAPTLSNEKETRNPYLIDTSELSAESKKELEKYIKLLKLADKAKNINDQMETERKFKPKYQN